MVYAVRLFIVILSVCALATMVLASNYPPDYCQQRAVVHVQGPALLGYVSSGCMGREYVIGYKKSGVLGTSSEKVNVYVRGVLDTIEGREVVVEQTIPLGREWHGTGYLSAGISEYLVFGNDGHLHAAVRGVKRIELAFNVDGRWDSNLNKNYLFDVKNLEKDGETRKSKEMNYYGSISMDLWDFIVGKMK